MTADLKACPRVYVVDDDPGIRQTIRRLIEPMGLPVDEYSCVEQFLGAYDPRQVGCLVLDYQLEGISGIELLEYFARSGQGIPTIMITGAATTEIVVRAMKNGALTVLAKPFRHKELLQAIQDALKRLRSSVYQFDRSIPGPGEIPSVPGMVSPVCQFRISACRTFTPSNKSNRTATEY